MHIHNIPADYKRLDITDSFPFSCHSKLSCFGLCCRNRDLQLTPYDVLRLKNALDLDSDDFLTRHTVYKLDTATGFPEISLKLTEDDRRQCPFLTSDGCGVYADRPTVCRLFPLARVSGFRPDSRTHDEFFYMLPEGPCLGGKENRTQTIEEWLAHQGLEPYRKANDKMLQLIFHPDRSRNRALGEKRLQKIIVACYNLDVFREFVFRTRFLDTFSIDASTRSRIEKNDFDLLMLGIDFLRTTLFAPTDARIQETQPWRI